jgi:capsular polysaccharide biosynthesis protein
MSADRLKLQREAARADYLALTARRAAAVASRAESLSLGSIVVVDRAVRADAAVVGLGPGKLAIVLAILSLILAVAAAYVADILDRRLAGADQIERLYGVPLVALIDMGS